MKALIDPKGHLHLERGGAMKPMDCRFTVQWTANDDGSPDVHPYRPVGMPCNDSCSLFGEPTEMEDGSVMLPLCQSRTLILSGVEDERGTHPAGLVQTSLLPRAKLDDGKGKK